MKVGIMLPTAYPWELNVRARDTAHAIGADSLWTADHLLGSWHPEVWRKMPLAARRPDSDAFLDPFCVCAALGPTTDMPLGVAVTDGIRRGAPDVARSALTLQQMCKGGFNLGIGSGEAENLVPFEYPYDRPVAALERFLKVLRHILDTGRMPSGPGRIGLPLESSAGRPRLWVAGNGPRTLRLCGQYADGWMASRAMTMGPEQYGEGKRLVAAHAKAVGRTEPESGLGVFILLGESRVRVREMFEAEPLGKLLALVLRAEYFKKYGFEHPLGGEHRGILDLIPHALSADWLEELAPKIPFEVLEEVLMMGNVDEILTELKPYADQGCEHVMLINNTGLVGGISEVMAQGPQLAALRESLSYLRSERDPQRVSLLMN